MTLRAKLGLSLLAAALLPMGVAVGVPLFQAGRRAREETDDRVARARRQATALLADHLDETADRVARAAADLEGDRDARRFLRQGTGAAAASIARSLAGRFDLDRLEIRDRDGGVAAAWPAPFPRHPADRFTGAQPERSSGGSAADRPRVILLPRGSPAPSGAEDDSPVPAHIAAGSARDGGDHLTLVGASFLAEPFIRRLGEISGEPVLLLDPGSGAVAAAGDPRPPGRRVAADLPLGDTGWRIRQSVAEVSAWRIRRELLASLAGVAPLAVISALVVGALLAQGIARPIRALATRVDALAAEHAAAPLSAGRPADEVRRLTASFDQMLAALEESERQRGAAEKIAAWQEVARRIAHEVKNPLSPIRLAAENLRRTRARSPGDLDRALEEESTTILEEVDSLARLVDEFSEFARLPGPRPGACDLRAVIAQVLALFAARLESEQVRVAVDDAGLPASIRADADQIGRVLKNVVGNALDAMRAVEDRRLAIEARRVEEGRGAAGAGRGAGRESGDAARTVEIVVRDSGPGFTPEALRRVFEPYFTTRQGGGGTGLGMAIAYRIVADHGGTIRAGAAPGGGAAITLRLPIDGPQSRGSQGGGPPEERWRPS
jgi:signal transduction histidine kinase